jgi:hypothetical protein
MKQLLALTLFLTSGMHASATTAAAATTAITPDVEEPLTPSGKITATGSQATPKSKVNRQPLATVIFDTGDLKTKVIELLNSGHTIAPKDADSLVLAFKKCNIDGKSPEPLTATLIESGADPIPLTKYIKRQYRIARKYEYLMQPYLDAEHRENGKIAIDTCFEGRKRQRIRQDNIAYQQELITQHLLYHLGNNGSWKVLAPIIAGYASLPFTLDPPVPLRPPYWQQIMHFFRCRRAT